MSGFVVQGPKSDYRDSSGLKNRLFPHLKYRPRLGSCRPTASRGAAELRLSVASTPYLVGTWAAFHLASDQPWRRGGRRGC